MLCVKSSLQRSGVAAPPFIVRGCAGSGKTFTVENAVFEILEDSQKHTILLCAPSYSGADTLALRLVQSSRNTNPSKKWLCCILDEFRPTSTCKAKLFPYVFQNIATGMFTLEAANLPQLLGARVIVTTCRDSGVLAEIGLTNRALRLGRLETVKAIEQKLVASGMTGVLADPINLPSKHFTHLIVDEAAQATVPETMIPLSVVVDDKSNVPQASITLCGDPAQLNPELCLSEKHSALHRSLIEELASQSTYKSTPGQSLLLRENYRSHPSILMMPSVLCYDDELLTSVSLEGRFEKIVDSLLSSENQVVSRWPVMCFGVFGKEKFSWDEVAQNKGWSNTREIKKIEKIVEQMLESGAMVRDIGVISPYRSQVKEIRANFRKRHLGELNVGTVHDYQGIESNIVILSTVRTSSDFKEEQNAGVLLQHKSANVAMTRAKRIFVLVDDPRVLIEDPIWLQYLFFLKRHGLFFGDTIVLPRKPEPKVSSLEKQHSKQNYGN